MKWRLCNVIYKYRKYKDIDAFVDNVPKTKKDEDYTILFKCNGFDYKTNSFTNKCFGCLFCIFGNPDMQKKFVNLWGETFISAFAKKSFQGQPVTVPNAKQSLKNPYKNLELFTGVDETSNIQPWASGIVNHMCTKDNRISMEVPVFNLDYDRNGRLDICSMTNTELLVLESKISLDDALKDERFIEQRHKYTVEIEKSTDKYTYLTLFGGKETDLFPVNNPYCSGKIGGKSERFYSMVVDNNIPFISATALWCLCCRYLTYGDNYAWDTFLKETFNNPEYIGLISAGKVINHNGSFSIECF